MKPREIRKAKPELVEGWLCVDGRPGGGGGPITFFPDDKPSRSSVAGCWRSDRGPSGMWSRPEWRKQYGRAALPKPSKCERVRLEL